RHACYFCSSRRRHTRSKRDWSSDVCSSDLDNCLRTGAFYDLARSPTMLEVLAGGGAGYIVKGSRPQTIIAAIRDAVAGGTTVSRSEERRVRNERMTRSARHD